MNPCLLYSVELCIQQAEILQGARNTRAQMLERNIYIPGACIKQLSVSRLSLTIKTLGPTPNAYLETHTSYLYFYIAMSYKESIVQCEEGSFHQEGMSETEDGCRFNGSEELRIEKRILHKIDVRLVPILGLLYTASLVDRSNISVARISGLDEDVDLDKGNRASIALLVFFIGYIIFEIPSNIVIQSVGVANWIAGITFAWGLVCLGIGFLSDWVGLAICRAVLGIFEAGFYPGYVALIKLLNANLNVADVSI